MAMVVECESCRSRFRLNESLLKESKAVRFRCRKCGGSIMVRNPHAPPDIPDSAVPAIIAAPPMVADISPLVRPGIGQPVPPRRRFHPRAAIRRTPFPLRPYCTLQRFPGWKTWFFFRPEKTWLLSPGGFRPPQAVPWQKPPRRRLVDPPAGRGRPLLRNHGGRAGPAGQVVPLMGIGVSGERRRETGLRRSGDEVNHPGEGRRRQSARGQRDGGERRESDQPRDTDAGGPPRWRQPGPHGKFVHRREPDRRTDAALHEPEPDRSGVEHGTQGGGGAPRYPAGEIPPVHGGVFRSPGKDRILHGAMRSMPMERKRRDHPTPPFGDIRWVRKVDSTEYLYLPPGMLIPERGNVMGCRMGRNRTVPPHAA